MSLCMSIKRIRDYVSSSQTWWARSGPAFVCISLYSMHMRLQKLLAQLIVSDLLCPHLSVSGSIGFRDPHAWHPQHSRTPQALAAWQLADRWDDRIRMSRNHCRAPSQAPGPALPPGAGRGSGQSCQDNRAPRLSQGPSLCRSGGAPQLPPQTEHRRPLVTQLFGPRQPTAAGATPRNRPGVRRLTPDGDHGPVLRRRQFEHAGVRRPLPVDGCTDHQP